VLAKGVKNLQRKNKRQTVGNRTLAVLATQARAGSEIGTVEQLRGWAAMDMLQRARQAMSVIKIALVTTLLGIIPVRTQDPITGPGYTVKVEFENEQIRVLRVHYLARAKSPVHSHPGRAVVAVTGSHLRVTMSDGTTREMQRHPGEVYWGDSVSHSAENLTDEALETVEIEVKKANAPGVPVKTASADTASLKEPVPVEREPHHHVVFQNQYARVLDVFFPVGEPALFHTHSNDNVSVELSGDKTKSQTMGGEWSAPGDVVPGRVGFHKAVGQPYTHRVGSAGAQPYHVIDVEIFP
jgi:quercetin dioxygenase-like cupin family protein